MPWIAPVQLSGPHATLVPLQHAHCDALIEAAMDGALWSLWYTNVGTPDTMAAEIAARIAAREAGTALPFTVIDPASDTVVGMTSYGNLDADVRRLEIGWTWYARRVQRTALNTDAKLLLLTHAFEQLDCVAVELRTHAMNQQSRRAIERLGAKLDGILRHHRRAADGTLRDTCVYSIIAADWPTVRANLMWLRDRPC